MIQFCISNAINGMQKNAAIPANGNMFSLDPAHTRTILNEKAATLAFFRLSIPPACHLCDQLPAIFNIARNKIDWEPRIALPCLTGTVNEFICYLFSLHYQPLSAYLNPSMMTFDYMAPALWWLACTHPTGTMPLTYPENLLNVNMQIKAFKNHLITNGQRGMKLFGFMMLGKLCHPEYSQELKF